MTLQQIAQLRKTSQWATASVNLEFSDSINKMSQKNTDMILTRLEKGETTLSQVIDIML